MRNIFSLLLVLIVITSNAQIEKYNAINNDVIRKDFIYIQNKSIEFSTALQGILQTSLSKKISLPICEFVDTFEINNSALVTKINIKLINDSLIIENNPMEIMGNSFIFINKRNYQNLNSNLNIVFIYFDEKYINRTIKSINELITNPQIIDNTKALTNNNQPLINTKLLTTDKEYDLLSQRIENMNNNMKLCHQQYKTGTTFLTVGILLSLASSVFVASEPDSYTGPLVLSLFGLTLTTLGGIQQMDSHKYLGNGYSKN